MDKRELKSIIEALLFTWGDPLDIRDIAKIIDLPLGETRKLLEELMDELDYQRRGLRIVRMENSYQIGTRPEHFDWLKKLKKQRPAKTLSNAALETLSIIAYKQPIIKSDIEFIRGVKCDRVIQTLIERELVEEQGRLDRTGRPIIYGTTDEFLKIFSLKDIRELPDLEKVNRELIENEIDDEIDKLDS